MTAISIDSKRKLLSKFIRARPGKKTFPEHEVKRLLKELGVAVPRGVFRPKGEGPLPSDLSYPLAAKISSERVSSKTDRGGVRLGIRTPAELNDAVKALSRIEAADGVLIEEMAPSGVEVIVGGVVDSQFGPVVMFGLGGIFVELFKDVAFGLAPLTEAAALSMVEQVKAHKLLEGYRGSPPLDRKALVRMLIATSQIMATGMIEEIDLNPVVLYPSGAIVLDAKMTAL
jgi:succinyl-CoA synthetase beta subunit